MLASWKPDLLLMDARAPGLAPRGIRMPGEQIGRLHAEGVTVPLSEQNVAFAGPLAVPSGSWAAGWAAGVRVWEVMSRRPGVTHGPTAAGAC